MFISLSDYIAESMMSHEYVDIRRLNPVSFDRQRCLFVRMRAGGRRYNYYFTIARHQKGEYYLKVDLSFDFYTYKRGSMLARAISDSPRRASLNGIKDAWVIAKDFIQQEENWKSYFDGNANLSDTPESVEIDKVLIHHDKQYSDNRMEWRWIQQTIGSFLPSATVSNSFQTNKMGRDVEARLSEPIVLKPI